MLTGRAVRCGGGTAPFEAGEADVAEMTELPGRPPRSSAGFARETPGRWQA